MNATDTSDFEVSGGTPEEVNAARAKEADAKPAVSAPAAVAQPTKPATGSGDGDESVRSEDPPHDRDEQGRFRGRHRARSQQAGPEDVPRIAALTKKLRETEASYEARIKALEERLSQPAQTPSLPAPPKVAAPQTSAFTEKEPVIDDFADQPDPYAAWLRAVNAYDRKKELFEAKSRHEAEKAERATKSYSAEHAKWINDRLSEHAARFDAFVKANPSAVETLQRAAQVEMTPALVAAVAMHPEGPKFMLALAQDEALADELYILTHGRDVGDPTNNPLVAKVQRRLLAKAQAAATGSAAPPKQVIVAPRPPNPVRTAPQTPADTLPGDDDSLEAHEKVWGPNVRGRRRR